MPPSVLVFTLDCLRAATASSSTTPFLKSLPIQWSRCFSSGTWTLPAHASLFSGRSPFEHDITRPGNSLNTSNARLSRKAKEEGYETTIFSENPTFSSHTGFDHFIDNTHDDIQRKLFLSDFSPHNHIDEIDFKSIISLLQTISSTPNRYRNLANTAYASYLEFTNRSKLYPHHGERLISHLESYLTDQNSPSFTVANILEPHNPYHGTPPGAGESRDRRELDALKAASDNRVYLLTDEDPPESAQSVFGGWETIHNTQECIYEEYATESDRLLTKLRDSKSETFDESLVVIVGDHGQLFGAEGLVGHHTSLHPHGINVPLAVSPPSEWRVPEVTVTDPVSIAGLGQALMDVCSGEICTTDRLIERIRNYSRECNDAVITCSDGPTWAMSSLYGNDRYDRRKTDALGVRKVACIRDDRVNLFQSSWDSAEIEATSYMYIDDSREIIDQSDPSVPQKIDAWLRKRYDLSDERRDEVSSQLEALGYV